MQNEIPISFSKPLPEITEEEVLKRIKNSRKTTSAVPGDLPCQVYKHFPEKLLSVITNIFNCITQEKSWPRSWSTEYVTIIPKAQSPDSFDQCRNISCTNYLSKLYESFVLEWARGYVAPGPTQFGWEKGCGPTHFLVEMLDFMSRSLEDNRAGVIMTSVDYSKASNRCLREFCNKGASNEVIQLLSAFLMNRKMTVRVGESWSDPKPVNSAAPQGSVLGCFLFNIGIDTIEQRGPQQTILSKD